MSKQLLSLNDFWLGFVLIAIAFLSGAFFVIQLQGLVVEQLNVVATELCEDRLGHGFVYKSVDQRAGTLTCAQAEQEYIVILGG